MGDNRLMAALGNGPARLRRAAPGPRVDAFAEWLAHAGQPGGAPAGVVRTVRQVVSGH